MPHLLRFCTAF